MSAPAPLCAMTAAGTILVTTFIVLSAVVRGINARRIHSASTYEAQAGQAQSDKTAVDQQVTETKAALDAATVRKDAESRRDSITRESAVLVRDSLETYDSTIQTAKDAIHEQCTAKETLTRVCRTNKDTNFAIAAGECITDQVTTTVNGMFTLKDSPLITLLGTLDVEISGFTADKGENPSPGSPYQGTTTIALTPGSPATFILSIPYDPAMTDKTECGATVTGWWPFNLWYAVSPVTTPNPISSARIKLGKHSERSFPMNTPPPILPQKLTGIPVPPADQVSTTSSPVITTTTPTFIPLTAPRPRTTGGQIAITIITSVLAILFAITTLIATSIYSMKSKDLTETQEELSTVQQGPQEVQEAVK